MVRPLLTEAEKHAHHHDLIAERKAALDAAPKRSGVDKVRRKRLGQSAWWTFTGHLRGMHAVKGQAPFLGKTWADLEALHDRLHGGEP